MKAVIHKYKEINIGKYKSVKHFELVSCDGKQVLTDLINLSTDRQFAKSSPVYWLKIHNGKKWSNAVTGLFKVPDFRNVFFGDLRRKTDLVLAHYEINPNGSEISLHVYPKHYPYNKFLTPSQVGQKIVSLLHKKTVSRV
ncbi:hypothetical protein ES692_05925 [Psychroserpens burtonensis]|uniref:Uncharacterized protein n=1 Tax=Psychroserpens burtonensis TaxID=49278 RepID=A0A5C7BDC0_9FLAO|nr:hypothetical protein [Psychroserpens burtonensis]TXE18579.1 hypothetical protein ES692_05925 [Psychroserpens burtonensis]